MEEITNEEIVYGIPRKIGTNGELIIPMEFRKYIGMENEKYVAIFVNKDNDIVIRPISAIRG